MDPQQMQIDTRNRNRWVLIGLAVLFMTPVLAAIYLNSNLTDWRPGSLKVNGHLIQPVVAIPDIDQLANAPWHRGLWSMLVVAEADCDQTCQGRLEKTSQVFQALGRLQAKIEQTAVFDTGPTTGQFSGLTILDPDSGISHLLTNNQVTGEVFLVDPFGNIMMSYAQGFDPTGMRKDLQRLLKHDYQ